MEDPKDKNVSEVSRRGMLKWAGALAAVGVVGVGLGFGGDLLIRPSTTATTTEKVTDTSVSTQMVTASGATITAPGTTVTSPANTVTAPGTTVTTTLTSPPTTISQQQMDSIVQQLTSRHTGDTVTYAALPQAHWYGSPVKVYTQNGIIKSVVAGDDTIHQNVPREDSVMSDSDFVLGKMQARGKANIYTFPPFIQGPQRILYPMKRVNERGTYPGQFVRITWDEALDTVANTFLQLQQKYGNYFHFDGTASSICPLEGYFAPSTGMWGDTSYGAIALAGGLMYGDPATYMTPTYTNWNPGLLNFGNISDIFNSKLIIQWGNDPATAGITQMMYGGAALYYKLAKERGIPSICIDPINTMTANTLCDQWIPIRVGTDSALAFAIANVLFKENLYDVDYVSKFVEPTGFQKFQDYVLGNIAGPDGAIDRNPQWAEQICGVPAATIQNLAEVYAASKPAYMILGWGSCRQHQGDIAARAVAYLQVMTGNVGVSGGMDALSISGFISTAPTLIPAFGQTPDSSLLSPNLFKLSNVWNAILLRDDYQNGAISKEEYYQSIGNDPNSPAPNIHALFLPTGSLTNSLPNCNKAMEAVKAVDILVVAAYFLNSQAQLADILLPETHWLENVGGENNEFMYSPGPFHAVEHGIVYIPRIVPPQGEAKDFLWTLTQLTTRFGTVNNFMPNYTTDAEWDSMVDAASASAYNAYNQGKGGGNLPDWNTFKQKPYLLGYGGVPYWPYLAQVQQGAKFSTTSGKIEFYSNWIANTDMTQTRYGPMQPMAMYDVQPWGFFDPKASQYPLEMIDVHTRQRDHTQDGGNPQVVNELFVHRLWINPADAVQRGIEDNDQVLVYNDIGQVAVNAYVTSRITPGVTILRHGAWFAPDSTGIDRGGQANTLMHDDFNACGQEPHNTLVQVVKWGGSD